MYIFALKTLLSLKRPPVICSNRSLHREAEDWRSAVPYVVIRPYEHHPASRPPTVTSKTLIFWLVS